MVPPGGFLRGEQFERERVVPPLSRLLCILSCRSKKVWPRWQALAESRLKKKTKGSNRGTITTSKYRPKIKPSASCPLAPSVTATPCQLPPGGSYGVRTFPHWIAAMGKCLLWNPSVKNQRFLTAPTGREPCGQCPQTISHAGVPPVAISHGNLLRIVTAPPVPGIVTEQNGERKYGHCAHIDSGGTPPKKSPWAEIPSGGIGCF